MASAADKIIELRTARGITQSQLANALFVLRSLIAMWESGERQPEGDNLYNLAKYFEVDTSEIACQRQSETEIKDKLLIELEINEFCDQRESTDTVADGVRILEVFLAKLSELDKALFMNRYFLKKSCANIAREYQMKGSTIRSRLARIRKKLKKYFNEETGNDK